MLPKDVSSHKGCWAREFAGDSSVAFLCGKERVELWDEVLPLAFLAFVAAPPAGFGNFGFYANAHALADEVCFELCDCGEHGDHHPSCWGCEVHVVADGDEGDAERL